MIPDIVSARRAGKRAQLQAIVQAALDRGEHVHVAEAGGVRCANGTCPADERGFLPKPKVQGNEPEWVEVDGVPVERWPWLH